MLSIPTHIRDSEIFIRIGNIVGKALEVDKKISSTESLDVL